MTNLVELIRKAVRLVFKMTESPNDRDFVRDGVAIGVAGVTYDIHNEMGNQVLNTLQIYSTQPFDLRYSRSDKTPDTTWPRRLAAGQWQTWVREGYFQITITPTVAAVVDVVASAKDDATSILRDGGVN